MEGLLSPPLYRGGNEVQAEPFAQGHIDKLSMLPSFRLELLQHFLSRPPRSFSIQTPVLSFQFIVEHLPCLSYFYIRHLMRYTAFQWGWPFLPSAAINSRAESARVYAILSLCVQWANGDVILALFTIARMWQRTNRPSAIVPVVSNTILF